MISEEEKQRIEDAMSCDNCLCWHKYCKAECCKLIYLNIDKSRLKEKGKYLNIKKIISTDDKKYYTLHGVKYAHGLLRFPKEYITELQGTIVYYRWCDYLNKDLTCKGYPNNRPQMCKDYNEEDLTGKGKSKMTSNCLYRYKQMVKEYGKEK